MPVTTYLCTGCQATFENYDAYDRHRRAVHGRAADGRLVVSEPTIRDLAHGLDELRREIAVIRALLNKGT